RAGRIRVGYRPSATLRLRRVRHLKFHVGHPVAIAHEVPAVLGDQDRSAEPASFEQCAYILADSWCDVGAYGARCLLSVNLAISVDCCLSIWTQREVRESYRGKREQHYSLLQCKQVFHSSLRERFLVDAS